MIFRHFLQIIKILFFITATLLFTGCASNLTGYDYDANEARQAQSVDFGKILDIQKVKIDGAEGSSTGTIVGAGAGAILGSTVGSGGGKALATAGGAIVGGLLGRSLQNRQQKRGINIIIKLCDGKTISVVQSVDRKHSLRIGDNVLVSSGVNHTRVTRDTKHSCEDFE